MGQCNFLHLWHQKLYRAFRFGTLWPISCSYPRHSQLTRHSLMLANGRIRQSLTALVLKIPKFEFLAIWSSTLWLGLVSKLWECSGWSLTWIPLEPLHIWHSDTIKWAKWYKLKTTVFGNFFKSLFFIYHWEWHLLYGKWAWAPLGPISNEALLKNMGE